MWIDQLTGRSLTVDGFHYKVSAVHGKHLARCCQKRRWLTQLSAGRAAPQCRAAVGRFGRGVRRTDQWGI